MNILDIKSGMYNFYIMIKNINKMYKLDQKLIYLY